MITLIGDTETARSFLEDRELMEHVDNLVTADFACGLVAKLPQERVYVVKFVDGEDVEITLMHLVLPDEAEEKIASAWFYSIIDPGSVVGVQNEDITA